MWCYAYCSLIGPDPEGVASQSCMQQLREDDSGVCQNIQHDRQLFISDQPAHREDEEEEIYI